MGLLPDELKTQIFPCPSCGHYVNDEVNTCKHCGTAITDGMRTEAIAKERAERKKAHVGAEKQTIVTGLVILGIGVINLLAPIFDLFLDYSSSFGFRVPCISSIAIIFGIVVILFGLRGYLREKRK